MDEATPERAVALEDLPRLREKTEAVAELLRSRLERHLDTLRTLLGPERLLGRHVRSPRDYDAANADAHFDAVKHELAELRGRPLLLPREIADDKVTIDSRIQLHPSTYELEMDGRKVVITRPTRWLATYSSGYPVGQLCEVLGRRETVRMEDALEFALSAAVLRRTVSQEEHVATLLGDLRWGLHEAKVEGLGALVFLEIRAPMTSFRPEPSLIAQATRLSGVSSFVELVDTESIERMEDPLRTEVEKLLA